MDDANLISKQQELIQEYKGRLLEHDQTKKLYVQQIELLTTELQQFRDEKAKALKR